MHKWITFPKTEGQTSRQAHCDLPTKSYEREMSKEGFYGPATQFYHRHPPTSWNKIDGPLLPRAFDTTQLTDNQQHPWNATSILRNESCHIRIWKSKNSMQQLARNADGDDLLFIHQGNADLFCDFGHLSLVEGDYVLIPRGTMWRMEHTAEIIVLMIEATGSSFGLPDKGLIGHHAIFDPAMLDTPTINEPFIKQQSEDETCLIVKRNNQQTVISYPFNPLDAIGWHGDLSVVRINWRDIRPIMSHRYHLPPSAHTTFLTKRFVVCTFCPRPMETDPGALKVPFFHNNDDYDEVIFYHKGEFFSRDNIHPGMITLHPSGITHGPHPKALQIGLNAQRQETDEVAIMIDTRDSLEIDCSKENIEWKDYVNSWRENSVGENA